MTAKQLNILKWTARVLALLILLFGLPFYFGYGNPLPFSNPDYSIWENLLLFVAPIVFLGLIIGWKFEKTGGFLILFAFLFGILLVIFKQLQFPMNLAGAVLPGILYLIVGYSEKKP